MRNAERKARTVKRPRATIRRAVGTRACAPGNAGLRGVGARGCFDCVISRLDAAALAVLAAFVAPAPAGLTLGGSYENTVVPMYMERTDNFQTYDENRLRVDLDAKMGDAASFTGDIIFKKYVGATTYALVDFLPKRVGATLRTLAELDGQQLPSVTFSDTFYIDNAALFLQKKRTIFAIGIQQLPWGSGYAFNPTDLWNVKDVLDPTYEKPGKPAVKFEQGLGALNLVAALGFDKNYRYVPWTVSAGTHIGTFDVSLIGGTKVRDLSDPLVGTGEFHFRRYLTGASLSGQMWDIGVWSELAANREETDRAYAEAYEAVGALLDDTTSLIAPLLAGIDRSLLTSDLRRDRTYVQALVGADYTFAVGNGLHLMAEYLYNGEGKTKSDEYTIEDWADYFEGESLTMGRHVLFGGITLSPTDLSTLSLFAVGNVADRSAMLNPWYTYSIGNDCDLSVIGGIPIGGEETEFGPNPYLLELRLKIFW
jgi:hypothetical protein